METAEKELGCKALAVKCSFGGCKSGCFGTIYNNTRFKAKSGHDWIVPTSQGGFPIFPNGATVGQKKLISDFIEREKDRKVVKLCEELLKGQLIESINDNFILELKDDMLDYDDVSLIDILKHLRDKYTPQDVDFLEKILKEFEEPSDMTKPIDKYFDKQEQCQHLLVDSEDPIEDRTMVVKATQHLGKDPALAKKTVQFRDLDRTERTWENARRATAKRYAPSNKSTSTWEQNLITRPTPPSPHATPRKPRSRRRETTSQQRCPDRLTRWQAAVVKAETIDSHATTITTFTKTNEELVATNKQLVAQLIAAKLPFSPLGFPPNVPAPPTNLSGNGKGLGIHTDLPTIDTGHKNNTAGVAVKNSNNKWYFVAPQACSICGKPTALHVPENCKGPNQYKGPRRTQTAATAGTSV